MVLLIQSIFIKIFIILFLNLFLANITLQGSVDYKYKEFDSAPKDLLWCGNNHDYVLIITENNSLYQSDDKGFNWKKLNDILLNTGKEQLEPDDNEIGKVSELLPSPVDKNLVLFMGTHGINWITEDCGRKIKALNHGRKIHELVFHPTERNWLLASAYTIHEDFVNEPYKNFKEVFSTQDLGENWKILLGYVLQFNWGVASEEHIKAGIPKQRIIATYDPKGKGHQKEIGWNYKFDLIYSDDFFVTKKIGLQKGNKFLITKDYMYVAQVVDQDAQEVMLLSSNPKLYNRHYEFTPIEINNISEKFIEHSYTFLDYTENSVFLHINHFGKNSRYGHVYISDSTGNNFSLSLANNIRSHDNQCDFERIEGLEGLYIANIIDKDFIKEEEDEMDLEAMNEDNMDGNIDNSKNKKNNKKTEDLAKDFVTTVFTFNKGGSWERIKAPKRDLEGRQYDCDYNSCYLNLHGISSDYSHFYSVESAVGIIIANGNVGKYLSYDPEEISTFLSRDGGITWNEVRKGSHTYEIGDHGGLIVMADDQHPTDTILYTWDEGLQWQELRVSNEKLMIRNIVIEPSSISQNFVVYGESTTKKGKKSGVVIGLNFSLLNERRCTGADMPDSKESDYETWSPSDNRSNSNSLDTNNSNNCLMGRKTIYVRRKQDAECFNGLDYERKTIVSNCECTEKDYECDEGFYRPENGEGCTPVKHENDTINAKDKTTLEGEVHKPPKDCSGYFTISKGYRKIPGNTCVNGIKFDPIVVPCSSKFFSGLGHIFLVLIILCGGGYGIYYFVSKDNSFLNTKNKNNEGLYSYSNNKGYDEIKDFDEVI